MVGHKKLEATVRTNYVNCQIQIEVQKDQKVKYVTHVRIVRGKQDVLLAEATLAGSYNWREALNVYYDLIDGKLPHSHEIEWKTYEISGDVETTTYIGIWLGNMLVAEDNVPGVMTPEDALEDFQANSTSYKRKSGWGVARSLQLVA